MPLAVESNIENREVIGRGLHSNQEVRVQISSANGAKKRREAPVLFRVHLNNEVFEAPALVSRISGTSRSTALVLRSKKNHKLELKTIEHFMAAAFCLGNTPITVDLWPQDKLSSDSVEMPILGGGSLEWAKLLESFAPQVPAWPNGNFFRIQKSYLYEKDSKKVLLSPLDESGVTEVIYHIKFSDFWVQTANFRFDWKQPNVSYEKFLNGIARARTFGFKHEIESLWKQGLAMGGNLNNAILLDKNEIVNPEGFSLPNELAAHKIIDALGDFSLIGGPILGRWELFEAGHEVHVRCLSEALRNQVFSNDSDRV